MPKYCLQLAIVWFVLSEWDEAAAPLHILKNSLQEATFGNVVNTAHVRWASGS